MTKPGIFESRRPSISENEYLSLYNTAHYISVSNASCHVSLLQSTPRGLILGMMQPVIVQARVDTGQRRGLVQLLPQMLSDVIGPSHFRSSHMTMTMPTLMARRTANIHKGRWVGAPEEHPVKNRDIALCTLTTSLSSSSVIGECDITISSRILLSNLRFIRLLNISLLHLCPI